MANAKSKRRTFESRAERLNALADSIAVHNDIDGKVADLFREAAALAEKSSRNSSR